MVNNTLIRALLLSGHIAISLNSFATQAEIDQIASILGNSCPKSLAGVVDEFPASVQKRLTLPRTCSCVTDRVRTDKKLIAYLDSQARRPKTEDKYEPLNTYLALLAITSVHACLLPQLEEAKQALELPQ